MASGRAPTRNSRTRSVSGPNADNRGYCSTSTAPLPCPAPDVQVAAAARDSGERRTEPASNAARPTRAAIAVRIRRSRFRQVDLFPLGDVGGLPGDGAGGRCGRAGGLSRIVPCLVPRPLARAGAAARLLALPAALGRRAEHDRQPVGGRVSRPPGARQLGRADLGVRPGASGTWRSDVDPGRRRGSTKTMRKA